MKRRQPEELQAPAWYMRHLVPSPQDRKLAERGKQLSDALRKIHSKAEEEVKKSPGTALTMGYGDTLRVSNAICWILGVCETLHGGRRKKETISALVQRDEEIRRYFQDYHLRNPHQSCCTDISKTRDHFMRKYPQAKKYHVSKKQFYRITKPDHF